MLLKGVFNLRSLAIFYGPGTRLDKKTCNKFPAAWQLLHQRFLKSSVRKNTGHRKAVLSGNFDTLGAWNHRIEVSVNVEQSIKKGHLIPEISLENIGGASLVGRRKANEDRYIVREVGQGVLLFSIFDGHGGAAAVDYVSAHMADFVATALEEEEDLHKVLHQAFTAANEGFTHFFHKSGIAKKSTTSSGTTATVCLLRDGVELVVGHVGDSRAMLCRGGRSVRLTLDHSPDVAEERDRVEKCGGTVVETSHGKPRVQGRLEMTRSIGDLDLRQYGVTEVPETRSIEVKHHKDAFLVLATDGVHYVLNDQELVDIICHCKDPEEAARLVTDNALQFGSEDNATALIIPFGSWGKYENTSKAIRFSFGHNVIGRF